MKVTLYIDVGNTYTKFATKAREKWYFQQIETKLIQAEVELFSYVNENCGIKDVEKIFISSVVEEKNYLFERLAKNFYQCEITFLNATNTTKLNLGDANQSQVGADILANAIYAASLYKKAIVVSLGTATVISQVKNKRLQGAIIAPGLYNSYLNLIETAPKLPLLKFNYLEKNLGNNTEEALSIGFINGFFYMIESLAKNIDPKSKILITGGDAIYLKEIAKINKNIEFIDNMVIKGLAEEFDESN
ncbi:type III pantothenate kinase [Mycoplasmopsis agassizii]|uniref:type III pantothenate kinase n=1 Tax=Mycoplasmopsis agassizii TaxID=33922 RepID=UPI003527386B